MTFTDPFWLKVRRGEPSECWPWTGYTTQKGYGLTTHKGCSVYASRKAYLLTHPKERTWDMCICHRCDNPLCCNPDHLYAGSRADNMIDRFTNPPAEQRGARGRPTLLNDAQLERMWKMRADGATLQKCADEFGVHMATVCRYITAKRREKLLELRRAKMSRFAK